nr:probable serine/threonine-protein phosphatase 2A regulatory subunit B'' subunit TON2 [Tanacetum cinerariifolium]
MRCFGFKSRFNLPGRPSQAKQSILWSNTSGSRLCFCGPRVRLPGRCAPKVDPLRITLSDLLSCKQGGTVASMLIDVRGFWAHDNRENLLQEEEEPEEE